MVGATLQKAIHRVEGVAGKRRRDFPFMVVLVDVFVNVLVVKETMYPVDTHISEKDKSKGGDCDKHITNRGFHRVVKFAVPSDLE